MTTKKYNNSKSALILQKYTPEDIQKFLNSGESKTSIAFDLGIQTKVLSQYIEQHNLSYKTPDLKMRGSKKLEGKNTYHTSTDSFACQERTDALEKFYEMLTRKKEKRVLRELKNPYDW